MNFKNRLENFMRGRYGTDQLNLFIFILILIIIVANAFLKKPILNGLSTILIIYAYYRILSKDINARYNENKKFLETVSPISTKINFHKRKFENRKEYKYIKCPNCKLEMRVPRGKGKLIVKCKKCNEKFNVKS